ncbi:hypothetical protein F4809DRAFT_600228 [Biscogniauxia mediterranea]|nr:hypothetical protein F4809DRAFT_600228 [Biscogniauxia mediterranea]
MPPRRMADSMPRMRDSRRRSCRPSSWRLWTRYRQPRPCAMCWLSRNRFAIYFRLKALKTEAGRAKRIAVFVDMPARGETLYLQNQGVRGTLAVVLGKLCGWLEQGLHCCEARN